jgi:hypothetical protein
LLFVVSHRRRASHAAPRLAGSLASRVEVLHLQNDHLDAAGKPAG